MDESLKGSWKQLRVWAVVFSICILLLGVVMVIRPKISSLAVCIVLGVVCIAMGWWMSSAILGWVWPAYSSGMT